LQNIDVISTPDTAVPAIMEDGVVVKERAGSLGGCFLFLSCL
jgi:hypothetical protein